MVLVEQVLDRLLLLDGDVGDDEVLVGGKAEDSLVDLGDLAQGRLEGLSGLVLHATVLDKRGKVPTSVLARRPTELVDVRGENKVARGSELPAETLLDLGDKVLDAHAVDGVLDTSVLATVRE